MPDETKELTKVSAETSVAREIKVIAANEGRPMYAVVEEMLSIYKAAKVETLPKPKGGKKMKLVKAIRSH